MSCVGGTTPSESNVSIRLKILSCRAVNQSEMWCEVLEIILGFSNSIRDYCAKASTEVIWWFMLRRNGYHKLNRLKYEI